LSAADEFAIVNGAGIGEGALSCRSRRLADRAIPPAVLGWALQRLAGGSAFALALAAALLVFQDGQVRAQPSPADAQSAPAGSGAAACVVAPKPNSLWSLAQCCAKDLKSNPGCRYYSRADEFIILKDNSPNKPAAYLIIPTVRMTGIEDRKIFALPFADFWAYGWRQAQIYVKKPAAKTALAINSAAGRTQSQLHIHIACVRPDVAQTLARNEAQIGSDPASALHLALGPGHHFYRVIKVTGLTAPDSPYKLVAAMPGAAADMADQSIAVVGSTAPGSYYVLDTFAHGANPGSAEELLDQYCGR
jgi:CDP-diacylglycerol pyrophosphatase